GYAPARERTARRSPARCPRGLSGAPCPRPGWVTSARRPRPRRDCSPSLRRLARSECGPSDALALPVPAARGLDPLPVAVTIAVPARPWDPGAEGQRRGGRSGPRGAEEGRAVEHPLLEPLQVEVDRGRDVERDELGDDQAADDDQSEGPARGAVGAE